MKKICLITPGHISSNPRLVKEAKALSANGFRIHIVFTQYLQNLISYDEEILTSNADWEYSVIDWTGKSLSSKILRNSSGLRQRFYNALFALFPNNPHILALISNRHNRLQCRQAVAAAADLYIAHNLGALPVAVYAAKKNGVKSGFDAEDLHRYELHDRPDHPDAKRKRLIEDRYIPQTDYTTAGSPMIAEHYQQLFHRSFTPILNVFERTSFEHPSAFEPGEPLRLFWFSQTIGPNRGIETAVNAISLITDVTIELHLLGTSDPVFSDKIRELAAGFAAGGHSLHFHAIRSQEQLIELTRQFPIGLASESGFSINNDSALSNKLFTYIQCGLAVLASDTSAQAGFLRAYPEAGVLYKKENPDSLAQAIRVYASDREKLLRSQRHNHMLGQQTMNWETESRNFLNVINKLFSL
ncbi:MAG: glycosyltransferase family 4 protein [Mucilaginibacter polytrichastri]|nr:glycosyltransferase family 4 protein [Mucilaginibacter polytrichastri]